jgi:hypothetical protein
VTKQLVGQAYGGGAGILSAPTAFGAPERANPLLFLGTSGAIAYALFTFGASVTKGNIIWSLAFGIVGGYLITEIATLEGYVSGWYIGQTVYATQGLFGGTTQTLASSLQNLASSTFGSSNLTVNFTTPLTIIDVQTYPSQAGAGGETALNVQTAQGQSGWINSNEVSSNPS